MEVSVSPSADGSRHRRIFPRTFPNFEPRYDVSRREREVKSRTGTQNARTCLLLAIKRELPLRLLFW